MKDKIKITKATYNDLPEILQLQKDAFRSEAELYNDFLIDPLIQTLSSIQADFGEYTFLKAVHENEIVGSVKAHNVEGSCWIGRLIVKPAYQNQGIGKKLMESIEQEFSEAKEYVLFTGSKSEKNIRLYQSLGYEIVNEFSDDKSLDWTYVKMMRTT